MSHSSEVPKVFVAMPFDESFSEVYQDAVRPSIIDAGLAPLRVDELIGHRDIIDDIEQGIRDALIVFADLTRQNPNVFYEVGFARAIGKPLVVVTQDKDHVPFDLRQRRFIAYGTTGRGLAALRGQLVEWFRQSALIATEAIKAPKIHCHGTKFDVPNRNAFWNDLLGQSQRRFYLLGRSNKSWINKSERQSKELAEAIVRVINNGGTVRILSDRREEVVRLHRKFFREHVYKLVVEQGSSTLESARSSVKYVAHNYSNYGAVISDDRLVLLPTLNSLEFRDETLVLEILGATSPQFANYLGDIDRMIRDNPEEPNLLDEV